MPHDAETHLLSKDAGNEHGFIACEKMLGESIRPFMAEMFLVNAGIMASYIYSGRDGNVGDIVDSSSEMLQHPEYLRYAREAAVSVDWETAPTIALRMEFVHDTLTALFDLVFDAKSVGIEILGIEYRDDVADPADGFERFVQAVSDLRRADA